MAHDFCRIRRATAADGGGIAGVLERVVAERGSSAQGFYRRLGFIACGRLRDQVIIDGQTDDEIVMEMVLGS